jgi:heme a synthase
MPLSLNSKATLSDFKFIYAMEWSHRLLGRIIGLTFVLPIPYFFLKKRLSKPLALRLGGLSLLLGMQGVLGWYMVQSGLDQALIDDTASGIPRVSQYRLAAHLGAALALYMGMFGTGMAVLKDWRFATGEPWSGVKETSKDTLQNMMRNPALRRFKGQAWLLTGLVFLTAVSGKALPLFINLPVLMLYLQVLL